MRWLRLVLLLLFLPLGACSLSHVTTYPAESRGPYLLDAGDVIAVSVYGDETISKSYKVDETGLISVPLVGALSVRGLTTAAAAAEIASALSHGFMRNPNVAVQIDTYRPFFIQGAVKNAGQFAYVPQMTVRAAISTAGGFTDTASRSRATIYRKSGDTMQKATVDLDFPIYPGDTIVIAERWL